MNNSQLIDYIATNSGVIKKDAKKVLQKMVAAISMTLNRGGSVTISDLEIFELVRMQQRIRIHPKTRAVITVAANRKAKFRACSALTDSIN